MPEPEELQLVIDEQSEQESESDEGKEQEVEVEELSDGEIELAKKHGLYKENEEEEDEHKKSEEAKSEKDDDGKKKKEIEEPTFEDVEENEKLLDKYNKNEKALYWKWKTDKHKRQEAQNKAKELEEKLKESIVNGSSNKKLEKIKELLGKPDSLTIEALQEILEATAEEEKKPDEIDNAKVIQQKVALKASFAEKIGSAKYDNFEELSKLAKEVILADTTKTYQKLIDDSFLNDDVDENMLVERVVSIARLNPKYGEVTNQVKSENKDKVNRVLENSKKKISSASVNGASGRRIISESELTAEQALKLPRDQWNKLRQETRDRILKQIS